MNPNDHKTCDSCGLSFRKIYEQGWFGCARCYEVFADRLDEIIKTSHSDPDKPCPEPRQNRKEMRGKIEKELNRAVAFEEYELAAELRDQLQKYDTQEEH